MAAEAVNKIKLIFAGDFYPGNRTEGLCRRGEYDLIYNDLLPILRDKDISIVNLECPLTQNHEPIVKVGPHLKSDPLCGKALSHGGFDIVTLANNHILDYGNNGISDTLNVCRSAGLRTVGAALSKTEAEKPLEIISNSVRMAFLNFTENEFSIADESHGGANGFDPVSVYRQIESIKKKSDLIFLIIHGGNEMYPLPSPRLVKTYRFFADLGVTAVIGHHPHCASGFEIRNGVPIFYSLGNFVFDAGRRQDKIWYNGYFVRFTISGNTIVETELFPYEQSGGNAGLKLLKGTEREQYVSKIDEYSGIIGDEKLLSDQWKKFCAGKREYYLSGLLGLNRVGRALVRHRICERFFIKPEKMTRMLNLIRCEAHREASIEVLESMIEKD